MSIVYSWAIISLKTKTEGNNQDAVVYSTWVKTGVDENGNTGSFEGQSSFTSVEVPESEFIPFEQLSEEAVLNWIQEKITGAYEEYVDNSIGKQIADKANPPVEKRMPWAPPVEEPTVPESV